MANIRIEKKKNNPIWPWILGLLLIGLVAWGAFEIFDDNNPQDETVYIEEPVVEQDASQGLGMTEEPQAQTAETPAAVQEFISFANDPQHEMGLSHEYTSTGLNNLANALESVSSNVGNVEVSNSIEEIRKNAESIQKEPESLKHANMVNDAFSSATTAFEKLQQDAFPEMKEEVSELKETANQLKDKQPLLEQKEEVKSFFGESARVLEDFSQNNQNADQEM